MFSVRQLVMMLFLSRVSRAIDDQLGLGVFYRVSFKSVDDLLGLLSRVYSGRLVIVLDEFTYWVRYSSRVLGELQYFIDYILSSTKFIIVVYSSLVGVMYGSVLGYGSPLYGRMILGVLKNF